MQVGHRDKHGNLKVDSSDVFPRGQNTVAIS